MSSAVSAHPPGGLHRDPELTSAKDQQNARALGLTSDIAAGLAAGSGARLAVTDDVHTGVAGVDFVYTDVWLSLGEPQDQWDTRIDQLLPYQVNAAVMKDTGNPAAKFLHCLPALHNRDTEIGQRIYAKRGLDALEVTDEVFESSASVVFDQAENRMHTIKALMLATIGSSS
jgi:ornithine carbamoyltransferase